jgi:hypothetical protein
VTLAGFILTVVWNVKKHRDSRDAAASEARQIAVREAEERGKMEERQTVLQRQVDAAHDKIRVLDERNDEFDRRLTEFATDMKHVVKSVDVLVSIHTERS